MNLIALIIAVLGVTKIQANAKNVKTTSGDHSAKTNALLAAVRSILVLGRTDLTVRRAQKTSGVKSAKMNVLDTV